MARYHATVHSALPAADTFRYLSDFSNAEHWDPGTLAAERLDAGPVAVGTRFRLVVPFLGRRIPLVYAVTSHLPGRQVVLEASSTLLRATDRITVEPAGAAGAVVGYDAEVRLRGPLALLDPVLSRGFRAVGDRAAAGLAGALSATGPAAAGPAAAGPAATGPAATDPAAMPSADRPARQEAGS